MSVPSLKCPMFTTQNGRVLYPVQQVGVPCKHVCFMKEVRKGGGTVPILFPVYLNGLFQFNIDNKLGYHIEHIHTGDLRIYADNLLCLHPSLLQIKC